jgi:hypothetical protein
MPDNEWQKYVVGTENTGPGFPNDGCKPFETVYHLAHRRAAVHIVEDGRIRGGLVYDRGILRTRRIAVSWVSPNTWGPGSRYGNVEFRFPFEALLRGRTPYWVEVIDDYKIHALRILLTDKDRSSWATLYEPAERTGPWWHDEGRATHFFNGTYCLEFMIEGDVPLDTCEGIGFVKHHDEYCCENRLNPKTCPDLGLADAKAGALFLGRVLGENYSLDHLGLTALTNGHRAASGAFVHAMSWFLSWVHGRKDEPYGATEASPTMRSRLARAVVAAYGEGRAEDAKALLAAFACRDDFLGALSDYLVERLGLTERSLLGLEDYM